MDWFLKTIQIVFGNKALKIIVPFILGIVTITYIPKWLVTITRLQTETSMIRAEAKIISDSGDKHDLFQELKILELREESLQMEIYRRADTYEINPPNRQQEIRQGFLLKRLSSVQNEKQELRIRLESK